MGVSWSGETYKRVKKTAVLASSGGAHFHMSPGGGRFQYKLQASWVELTIRIEDASAEDGVHAFLEGITCT